MSNRAVIYESTGTQHQTGTHLSAHPAEQTQLKGFLRKMDVTAATPLILLFFFSGFILAQDNITAQTGQDVILPCQTPDDDPVIVVEWRRSDSTSQYVLRFRDDQLDPENQQPTFRTRVDLLFRPIRGRNASLVLNNVTSDDKGTYECQVIQRDAAGLTSGPVGIINLDVVPPGQKDDQEENDHVSHRGHEALIGVAVLLAAAAAVVIWRKIKSGAEPADEHQDLP